jgi:hypothetical protein
MVLEDDLERLVDRYGLSETLTALSLIAYEKATHIEENWIQRIHSSGPARGRPAADHLVKLFHRASAIIDTASRRVHKLRIPDHTHHGNPTILTH